MIEWKDLEALPDGTYLLTAAGSIINMGERWAYGYAVGIRCMNPLDLYVGYPRTFLFGVWTDENGYQYIDKVRITSDRRYAEIYAEAYQQKAIYDLRESKVIYFGKDKK